MDPKEEKYMRSLSFEEMANYMRIQNNTPFEAWRKVLSFVDKDVREKEIRRVEKVVKRAEASLKGEGIEIPLRYAREDLILEKYPYVEDAINKSTMEMVYHYLDKKNWDMFERIVLSNNFAKQLSFECLLNVIPDDRIFDLTVNVYKWGGAGLHSVQEMIKKLPEYGAPNLPDDFEEVMTVYRGCVGDADQAANSFSWTINPEVAKYFRRAQELYFGDTAHIYRGRIKKDDIAAYIPDLGQAEVVQLGRVFDVEDITDQVYDPIYEARRRESE